MSRGSGAALPLTLAVVVLATIVGYLRGGRLSRITGAQLRWSALLFLGLALQVGVDLAAARGWLGDLGGYLLLLASQLLVLGWVVANRYRPGMVLICLGLVLNAMVIGANGAMPVDQDLIRSLGPDDFVVPPGKHEAMTAATRLPLLADIIAVPPLATIISVGDVVLSAGLFALVGHLMTYRPAAERRGGLRGERVPGDEGRG